METHADSTLIVTNCQMGGISLWTENNNFAGQKEGESGTGGIGAGS